MNTTDSIRWHRFPDSRTLARAAAEGVLEAAAAAIAARGAFRLVLAGGRTPELAYRILAEAKADWLRWRIYFGDERCLPAQHPERNSQMARSVWLDRVAVPPGNVFTIEAELGPELAAARYASLIQSALPFDMVLLGMGEDGHTASLFPGQAHPPAELVHAVHHAPKPPPKRVSLGTAALDNAHRVLILVSGAAKREALRRWRGGEALPVAGIRGLAGVDVFVDRDAEG